MASNSKKRRRVLGVSCILAALIIASSSFAWFTSKDEVTNRLTASADYGVSIIENFAPPKQWVPGQTVTKEEAVTNTGSIDAFVKQKITGDLEVTTEVPDIAVPGTPGKVYVELNPNEYGAIEAGSYLAWKPAGDGTNELGRQVVYAIDNSDKNANNDKTDFTPAAEGLYIFRRAITTAKTDDVPVASQSTLNDTAYEYVGYYYQNGKYYKINRIVPSSLQLAENGEGNLAAAPTVMYSTTVSEALKPVAMKYVEDETDPRLEVEYQSTRRASTSAMAAANEAAYNAYNKYLNDKIGATTWDKTQGDAANTRADDISNKTGLINYDQYDGADAPTVSTADLSYWSLARLEDLVSNYKADLDNVSPPTTGSGAYTAENWKTVYDNAVAERKIVNKGVKSAERLDILKSTVEGKIGTAANGGLVQNTNQYPFYYSSVTVNANNEVVAPTVTLTNAHGDSTTPYLIGSSNAVGCALTLDNMRRVEFSDGRVGSTTETTWAVFADTATNFGAPFDYTNSTDNTLKGYWDAYVLATKRKVLNDAKIAMVEAAINDEGYSTTDIGRTKPELREYLLLLKSDANVIQAALNTAKNNYDTYIEGIQDNIDQLNKYQDDVNAANQVSKDPSATNAYGAAKPASEDAAGYAAVNVSTYPTNRSRVFDGTADGTDTQGSPDTGKEKILKDFLEAVYGFAVREDGTHNNTSSYTGEADSTPSDSDLYKDIYTYSPANTYETFKANIKNTDGVIGWQAPDASTGWNEIKTGADAITGMPAQSTVEEKPYYKWIKARMMRDQRQTEVNTDLTNYNNAKANNNVVIDADEDLNPIKIIVHLANIGDGTVADKWQYIEGATGNANEEFNFYYTSVLESGDTSSLLIKSVEMGDNVNQDMFRDLQFDLNVSSESAQAIYEDAKALPTTANEALTGAKTTQTTGYAKGEAVQWEKDTGAKRAIDDKDPQGKATAEVG